MNHRISDSQIPWEEASVSSSGFGPESTVISKTYNLEQDDALRLFLEGYLKSPGRNRLNSRLIFLDPCFCLVALLFYNDFSTYLGIFCFLLYVFIRITLIIKPRLAISRRIRSTPHNWWGLRTLVVTNEKVAIIPIDTLFYFQINRSDIHNVFVTPLGYHLPRNGYPVLNIPKHACSLHELEQALFPELDKGLNSAPSNTSAPSNPVDNLNEYELLHLVTHLEEAGLNDELHHLLALETENHRNAWFEIMDAKVSVDAYLNDLKRAWSLIENKSFCEIKRDGVTASLAYEIHYALLASTINNLAKIPVELLSELVKRQIWTPSRAFYYSSSQLLDRNYELSLDRDDATNSIAALGSDPPQELIQQLLVKVQEMASDMAKVMAIAALMPHLPQKQREDVLKQVLIVARSIKDDKDEAKEAEALSVLVPYVHPNQREGLVQEAFQLIKASKDRANAHWRETESLMKSLDPDSSKPEKKSQKNKEIKMNASLIIGVQAVTRNLYSGNMRKNALKFLAPFLPEPLLTDAIDEAFPLSGTIGITFFQALLPHLSDGQKEKLIERARNELTSDQQDSQKTSVEILVSLAPHLSNKALQEALLVAKMLKDQDDRASVFTAIASHLHDETRKEVSELAVEAAMAIIRDKEGRAKALAALAPVFFDEQRANLIREVLKAAAAFSNKSTRAQIVTSLIPLVSGEDKEKLIKLIVETAENSTIAEDTAYKYKFHTQVEILIELAQTLSGNQQEQVSQKALDTLRQHMIFVADMDDNESSSLVSQLAPHLSNKLLNELLMETRAIRDETKRTEFLSTLFPHLSDNLKRHSLAAVSAIRDHHRQVKAFVALVPHLPDKDRPIVLQAALVAASKGKAKPSKIEALTALAPHLSGNKKKKCLKLAIAAAKKDKGLHIVKALAALAPHLSGDEKNKCLKLAIAAAKEKIEYGLMQSLTVLIPLLPDKLFFEEIHPLIEKIDPTPYILGNKTQACKVVWNLELARMNASYKHMFSELPELPQWQQYEAEQQMQQYLLQEIAKLEQKEQLKRLIPLIPHLLGKWREEAVKRALDIARTIDTSDRVLDETVHVRFEALAALIHYLSGELKGEVTRKVLEIAQTTEVDSVTKVQTLAALISHQPKEQKKEVAKKALETALEISDQAERSEAFTAIATSLASIPCEELYTLWRTTLHQLATRTREELLSDFSALLPIIIRLGGPELPEKIVHSVRAVSRWWP